MSRTIGATTVDYVWDLSGGLPNILEDSQGNRYVYGLDLIARINGSTEEGYLADGLGSTAALTDDTGDVSDTYEYDAFGNVRTQTGATTEWSYTGEQNDSTGLEYLRARYYDPVTGRFLGQDPLLGTAGRPQTLNRYPYVTNNPANYVDPSGLCGHPWTLWKCADDVVNEVEEKVEDTVDYVVDTYQNGYIDVGYTGCATSILVVVGPCVTFGVQFGHGQGFHPYIGGGIGTPGHGLAINFYPNQAISGGAACGFQAGVPRYGPVGIGGEAGISGISVGSNKEGVPTFDATPYAGGGLYVGHAGASLTCYYVFPSLF